MAPVYFYKSFVSVWWFALHVEPIKHFRCGPGYEFPSDVIPYEICCDRTNFVWSFQYNDREAVIEPCMSEYDHTICVGNKIQTCRIFITSRMISLDPLFFHLLDIKLMKSESATLSIAVQTMRYNHVYLTNFRLGSWKILMLVFRRKKRNEMDNLFRPKNFFTKQSYQC